MNDLQNNADLIESPRAIKTQVREFFAADRGKYIVEWGARITDGALVFHFFPSPVSDPWDPEYLMPERLKFGIEASFDTSRVTCGYVEEMNSFYVICGEYGMGIDQRPLAKRFLAAIEAYGTAAAEL